MIGLRRGRALQPAGIVSQPATRPDILVVARTFLPEEGGIGEYLYTRCHQDPGRIVVLAASCPGDLDFDAAQPFAIHRWRVPTWLRGRKFGVWLAQLLSFPRLLVAALTLYGRYRYRRIEWGHGYDYPALLLLGYLLPVKCYIYFHGNDLLCTERNLFLRALCSWSLSRARGVVCNSIFTRDYLQAHFPSPAISWVINPSVRPEKFGHAARESEWERQRQQVRRRYDIPETAIVVLTVGRLVRRKGFDQVIRSLPRLIAAGIDVQYLICGRGEELKPLQTLARAMGVNERVRFAGYVSDHELAGYYAACDLFAMLTYFDSKAASIEGFGIVYLEAGFFGKAVLASDVGGVRDAVHHDQNGLLVPPGASEEIVEALQRLCQDEALRRRLGDTGRSLAARRPCFDLISRANYDTHGGRSRPLENNSATP